MSDAPVVADSLMLDVSNWDTDTWRPQCLYDAGVRRIIFGAFPMAQCFAKAFSWEDVGGKVMATYGLPYFGHHDYEWRDIMMAIQVAEDVAPAVMVDVEYDAADFPWTGVGVRPSVAQRFDVLSSIITTIENRGLEAIIYYGLPGWKRLMGDTPAFNHLKHVMASYGVNSGPRAPIFEVTVGGRRKKLWAHQYTSTVERCGRGRDHNYLLEEDDDMDEATVRRIVDEAIAAQVRGPLGAVQERVDDTESALADLASYLAGNPGQDPPEGGWDLFFREVLGLLGAHGGPEVGLIEAVETLRTMVEKLEAGGPGQGQKAEVAAALELAAAALRE